MRRIALGIICLFLFVGIFACEIDDDTISSVIQSTTSVAFTRILDNNPDLTDTFYVYAVLNKKMVIEREIDQELARGIVSDILMKAKDLEDSDRELVLTLFNTILPLIQLPEEGVLKERQKKFFVAFLNGMIQACETRRALEDPPAPPPVKWEV